MSLCKDDFEPQVLMSCGKIACFAIGARKPARKQLIEFLNKKTDEMYLNALENKVVLDSEMISL